ncbi:hypothetical protein [Halovenus marina]|uniref:hypothetical protein n=1 Tax=Halovenus marina TaxID=3396621 RepID=UPI003F55ED69
MSLVAGLLSGGIVAGVLLLLSSPLLYRGLKHRTRYRRFRERPVETPATATPGETALVTGTATENERGSISAPLSTDPALLAGWDIHSLHRYDALGVKHAWGQEALGVDTEGFHVRGDGQHVAVPDWSRHDRIEGTERLQLSGVGMMPVEGLDVKGLWLEIASFDSETRVLPGEELSDPTRRLCSRVGLEGDQSTSRLLPSLPRLRTPEGTRRFREATIEDGQTVTVVGAVRESSTPNGALQLAEPDDVPPLVSDHSPEELLGRYRRSYRKIYALVAFILLFASLMGVAVAL